MYVEVTAKGLGQHRDTDSLGYHKGKTLAQKACEGHSMLFEVKNET